MKEFKVFEYEDAPGESVGTLRINVPVLRRLFPAQTTRHLLAAQREMLLAVRSLIDSDIRRYDRD